MTFATAEALSGIHLDRNRDGVIDAEDVAAAEPDLKRFVLDGVDVAAGGAVCPAVFEGAAVDEVDGLVLRAGYQCPDGATPLVVTFYYLSALPAGHREVARVVAGPRSAQAVLSGTDRAIELALPGRPGRGPSLRRVAAVVAALAVAVLAAVLARRRRRPTS